MNRNLTLAIHFALDGLLSSVLCGSCGFMGAGFTWR